MLKKIWLNIGVEKVNIHKGIIIKVLLNSSIAGIFINRKTAAKYRFRLQKLKRPVIVRNIDNINNSAGAIIYQVEVNMYYKNHVKRIQIDICNLGKTDIILNMLWLQVHNLKINQEIGKISIMRYLLLYRKNTKLKVKKKARKKKGSYPRERKNCEVNSRQQEKLKKKKRS